MRILIIFQWIILCLSVCSCGSEIHVDLREKKNKSLKSVVHQIRVEDNQLIIDGKDLEGVKSVKLALNQNDIRDFIIDSKTPNQILASGLTNMKLAVGAVMNLIIADAYGESSTAMTINLADGSITVEMLSDMNAGDGDVLVYDQAGEKWEPRTLSGVKLMGAWDANTNSPSLADGGLNTSPFAGDYYIVGVSGSTSIDGESSWNSGDWIIFNGTTWDKISNTSDVVSFNGRQGVVSPQANDYTWNQLDKTLSPIGDLSNVDTTGAISGSVLKFNGTNWVVGTDNATTGSNDTVTSTTNTIITADSDADNSGDIVFQTAGTNKAVLTNDGDFNIGSTVQSGAGFTVLSVGSTTEPTVISLGEDANNKSNITWDNSNNYVSIGTRSASTDYNDTLVVKNGKVGIGTADPTSMLTLSKGDFLIDRGTGGSQERNITIFGERFDANGKFASLTFKNRDGVSNYEGAKITAINDGGVEDGAMTFSIADASTLSEAMRIESSGNVGIGTVSPASKLDVQGSVNFGATGVTNSDFSSASNIHRFLSGTGGFSNISIETSAVGGYSGLSLKNSGASGREFRLIVGGENVNGSGDGSGPNEGTFVIEDITAGVDRFNIIENGNIGIGTTHPDTNLEVINNVSGDRGIYSTFYGNSTFGPQFVGRAARGTESSPSATLSGDSLGNLIFAGHAGSGWAYPSGGIFTGIYSEATENQGVANFGSKLYFATVENGASGGATRMTIADDGNVGIGTTTPEGILDVSYETSGIGPIIRRTSDNDSFYTILRLYRSRSSATAPSAGFGTKLSFQLEGFTDNSRVPAGSVGLLWENDQTNDTTDRDSALNFYTMLNGSEAEKMRLNSEGNLGIGTASPDEKLHVSTSANVVGLFKSTGLSGLLGIQLKNGLTTSTYPPAIGSTTNDIIFYTGQASSITNERMRIDEDGNVGIGETNPDDALDVVGDVDATGCFQNNNAGTIGGTCVSDERLKENILPLEKSLDRILGLRPVSYIWRPEFSDIHKKEGMEVGLIAQEVEKVFPEMVIEKEDGFKRVKYDISMRLHIINAIKEFFSIFESDKIEQDRKIATIEAENEQIKQENQRIREENQEIKKTLCELKPDASFC